MGVDSLVLYLLFILVCLFALFYFATKIIDWYNKRYFKDSEAIIISELYRVQRKAMKRGLYSFADGIGITIKGLTMEMPQTEEGRRIMKKYLNDMQNSGE